MKEFSRLFTRLDETTSNNERIAALADFFRSASGWEATWGCYFLLGGKTSKLLSPRELRDLLSANTSIPLWLIEESYQHVGDLAETLTLLVPEPSEPNEYLLSEVADSLRALQKSPLDEKIQYISECWKRLVRADRFVFNKLITGSFRIGVQRATVVKGLSRAFEIPEAILNERLTGTFEPSLGSFERIKNSNFEEAINEAKPLPFYLAYPLEGEPHVLGAPNEWLAEWKWDGIRGQIIVKKTHSVIWSRGEEDVSDSFPELVAAAANLPTGIILDGEIVAYKDGPLPFTTLQKRLNRVSASKNLQEKYPIAFIAYDLLRDETGDIRNLPLAERRKRLAALLKDSLGAHFFLSEPVSFSSWEELSNLKQHSRSNKVEGLMLKHLSSEYGQGRRRGSWWKWKVDPFTADMVLIYAQRGHGRRAGLYTDFTFGVWHEGTLVPVAKAYSGLTDVEFEKINRFIRNNSNERFGPVRVVEPKIVMELAFEGINLSSRHKSGVALRFPRMKRIRDDKLPQDADSLETLKALLAVEASTPEAHP